MLLAACLATLQLAQALPPPGETRYALVVGAHVGRSDEATLAYAGKDAKRLSEVLIELGGFQPDNVVTLQDPDAGRFREALGRLNARLRAERAAGRTSLLLVYYSGHADQRALHLGDTALPWDELVTTVQGSAAELRLLVVDACRSGSATRVKGFHAEEPAALPPLPDPSAEGVAIFASATQGEDAQESDAIGASFFTHHLLAGLRGAADEDGDAQVTLEEVYRYARDQTVASTVTTSTGVQHPTYRYDFKGRQNVVLTAVTSSRSQGRAVLPGDGAFFFHERAADGPLAAEVHSRGSGTRVLLPSGRYVVRWRRPDRYYEGPLEVVAGRDTPVDPQKMRVFEYARLVRKGGGPGLATELTTFATLGSAPLEHFGPDVGAGAEFGLEFEAIGVDAVLWYAQAMTTQAAEASGLASVQRELGVLAGVRKAFDFGPLAASIGLRGGAIFLREDYADGVEGARHSAVPTLEVPLRLDLALGGPWSLVAEGGDPRARGVRPARPRHDRAEDGAHRLGPARAGDRAVRARKRAAAVALGVVLGGLGACDPLTEGGWSGTPAMVVRGELRTLAPTRDDAKLGLALVWTGLGDEAAAVDVEHVQVEQNAALGEFELDVRAPPAAELLSGPVPAAVAMFTVVDLNEVAKLGEAVSEQGLRAAVQGVSEEHYLLYVRDADAARASLTAYVVNPIAVRSGFNLAVGLCRAGRPSQLLVVSPEPIAVAAPDEARAGGCLDVFWGPWRAD